MSSVRGNGGSSSCNIHNPYASGRSKRRRTDSSSYKENNHDNNNNNNNNNNNRVVLLFDMDCFYAQCERVRLGLPLDVKLCLFQWNSVLAVTYPAREYGIKRGDSWDDVATKMKSKAKADDKNNNHDECYTIHLPILGHNDDDRPGGGPQANTISDDDNNSIEASYKRIFELSREERIDNISTENGRRRFHHQGKACLERYRLASMRIFGVVLESLQKRIAQNCDGGCSFVLERASIDEFYLDLTEYCYYGRNQSKDSGMTEEEEEEEQDTSTTTTTTTTATTSSGNPNEAETDGAKRTVVAGSKSTVNSYSNNDTDDPLEIALNRACRVSHWIRQDIWRLLGFTMSAGISTNKTMAKLAASYGKPNGQAVLYPKHFPSVLADTKVKKVRNFGGKLGKTVLKLLLQYQQQQQNGSRNMDESEEDALEKLKSTATMADLSQVPLPFLIRSKHLSEESARFVYNASQGIDHEPVKETSGALVKSITAFKSFTATKSHTEIFDRWLTLLATEIVERVARDSARNKRYPKSCTLNYTYYTTSNGQRPSSKGSTRSQRQSRSLRLLYPSERGGTNQQKSSVLLDQARAKLIPIVKDHPLRGVGLSASNFTASSVHQDPQQEGSIQSFFASKRHSLSTCNETTSPMRVTENKRIEVRERDPSQNAASEPTIPPSSERSATQSMIPPMVDPGTTTTRSVQSSRLSNPENIQQKFETANKKTIEDKDLAYARKLQASFDRENYALSTANRRRKSVSTVKKTQRIDNFFKKR